MRRQQDQSQLRFHCQSLSLSGIRGGNKGKCFDRRDQKIRRAQRLGSWPTRREVKVFASQSRMAPAARRRATTVESRRTTEPSSAKDPGEHPCIRIGGMRLVRGNKCTGCCVHSYRGRISCCCITTAKKSWLYPPRVTSQYCPLPGWVFHAKVPGYDSL